MKEPCFPADADSADSADSAANWPTLALAETQIS